MKIGTETVGTVTVLALAGELDSRGNQQLDRAIKEQIQASRFNLILDLTAIRFVGNQTVSLLVSNLKEIRSGGGDIKLLNLQKPVLSYLKQNRIAELFSIHTTRAEALRAFNPAEPAEAGAAGTSRGPGRGGIEALFRSGDLIHGNNGMLAALINLLGEKGVLNPDETRELLGGGPTAEKGENP